MLDQGGRPRGRDRAGPGLLARGLSTLPAPAGLAPAAAPHTRRLAAERPDLDAHHEFAERLFADPDVAATLWPAHLGGPRTPAQTLVVFERDLAHWDRHGFGQWWWRDTDRDELVARGGLQWTMVAGEAAVEVGWAVSPAEWRQGVATELARASLEVGFRQLFLDCVVAYTLATNTASRRVMQKAGLRYEREVRHLSLPHVLYRLRRDAYRAVSESR